MPTPLDEMFMAEAMTATVRRFAEQSAERSFIGVYEAGERLSPDVDTVKWDEVRYSRDLAPVTGPSSPSKPTVALGLKKRSGELLSIKQHVDLDARFIRMARGAGGSMPDPQGVLNENLRNLTNRIMRTKNYWAAKSLLTSNGQVDPGSFPNADLPAAAIVYTYPVRSQNRLAVWSDPATKIRSTEIGPLKLQHRRNSGMEAGYVIASDVVEGYITGNTEVTNLISGGSLAGRVVESSFEDPGGGLPRFGGLTWRFARDFYAADATPDTETDVIADTDLIAVLPDPSRWREVFALAEGLNDVPTGSITAMANGNPLALIATMRGWAAYVELMLNPLGFRLHLQWTGLLIQKVIDGVTVFNTT